MPRQNLRPRSARINNVAAVATNSLLEFLAPACAWQSHVPSVAATVSTSASRQLRAAHDLWEGFFLGAVSQASSCDNHRHQRCTRNKFFPRPSQRQQLLSDIRHATRQISSGPKPPHQTRNLSTAVRNSSAYRDADPPEDPYRAVLDTPLDSSEDPFRAIFDKRAKRMASKSRLPKDFFDDVYQIHVKVRDIVPGPSSSRPSSYEHLNNEQPQSDIDAQIRLLRSVRELEERLASAKAALKKSVETSRSDYTAVMGPKTSEDADARPPPVKLSREDYIGLVDLYYYSQKNRFTPVGPDYSPSLSFLSSHDIDASEVFGSIETARRDQAVEESIEPPADIDLGEDEYGSPLKDIEKTLLRNQRHEIRIMQDFVDLLLDDSSSNRDLFHAYRRFPRPGVAWLPKGIQRFFLQRMSTPWTRSRRAMLRYLSIIDDMQSAKLPITSGEWSSAVYLAGRSVAVVTMAEVDAAIVMWRKMEKEAGVRATNVTFNILFDIAVRAGRYALAESFLQEMYARDLRLNRLGRVSMIFYHGVRSDGDAVRRTYRDFIDAGEIVDTLVLNCVIASLLRAQEPTAAEQIYERMRDLQNRLKVGKRADGSDTFYLRYPDRDGREEREMAPNALGRILEKAPRLKKTLPDKHAELQDAMPLRPDHVTFRALISYHANVSGDLDRITVLLKQMTEDYDLPLRSVFYLLLFKGFALHGQPKEPQGRWSTQRLDLAWNACRKSILEARAERRAARQRSQPTVPQEVAELVLPKITELDSNTSTEVEEKPLPKEKRLDLWDDFVLDLAAFPRERRKPIERVHAQLFDDEPVPRGFVNPFFSPAPYDPIAAKETFYPLGHHANLDHEEGEYVLPPPSRTITHEILEHDAPNSSFREDAIGEENTEQDAKEDQEQPDSATDVQVGEPPDDYAQYVKYQHLTATRQMVCWLLRAYTQCTASRAKVEEIWGAVRKVYTPLDDAEAQSVVRVLQRCLRHCDEYSPYIL